MCDSRCRSSARPASPAPGPLPTSPLCLPLVLGLFSGQSLLCTCRLGSALIRNQVIIMYDHLSLIITKKCPLFPLFGSLFAIICKCLVLYLLLYLLKYPSDDKLFVIICWLCLWVFEIGILLLDWLFENIFTTTYICIMFCRRACSGWCSSPPYITKSCISMQHWNLRWMFPNYFNYLFDYLNYSNVQSTVFLTILERSMIIIDCICDIMVAWQSCLVTSP